MIDLAQLDKFLDNLETLSEEHQAIERGQALVLVQKQPIMTPDELSLLSEASNGNQLTHPELAGGACFVTPARALKALALEIQKLAPEAQLGANDAVRSARGKELKENPDCVGLFINLGIPDLIKLMKSHELNPALAVASKEVEWADSLQERALVALQQAVEAEEAAINAKVAKIKAESGTVGSGARSIMFDFQEPQRPAEVVFGYPLRFTRYTNATGELELVFHNGGVERSLEVRYFENIRRV